MSEVETQYLKHGYWNNIEHGSVLGGVITTDVRGGTVAIALLAILVTIATAHLWNLVVFGLHMLRADGRPADGLFQQQQALLRTATAPTSMLADWVKLWWVWRKRTTKALTRSILLCSLTSLFAAATIVAGVFSSYVVDTSNLHVLVDSPECGPLRPNDGNTFSANNLAFLDYSSKLEALSVPYAQECYQEGTSLPVRCRIFVQPNIPLVPERHDCPFADTICKPFDQPGVTVDSGLVDANEIFGWNLQAHQRLKYRRKTTCGVIKTQEYQTVFEAKDYPFNTRPLLPGEQNLAAHYGLRRYTGEWANLTMAQSLVLANVTRGYTVNTVMRWGAPERDVDSNFDPIPELATDNADLTLIMVTLNQVRYSAPVEDPFFSAHKPFNWIASTTDNMTVYFSDWPNAMMGCKQQHQLCHARKGAKDFCTDLSFLPDAANSTNFPNASELQIAGLQLILDASSSYTTYGAALKGLNATSKFASNNGFVTDDFPTDQWVTEVVGWEKYIWATFQAYISDYAVGFSARVPALKEYIQTNLTQGEKELCKVQRMVKPSGVMNISVLGLAIVVAFAALFTLADLIVLKFIIFLKRSRKALNPRIGRWIQDGVFQLQRRAYEANDEGIWVRQDTEVPATIDGQPLCELGVETSRHCCTHICAKKNGDVVIPRVGIMRGMTVMSDATTVYDGTNDEASSKSGSLKKGISLNDKVPLASILKE
ncbi:Nn.00g006070.m01.CDS01 [Neocucurbitaria sp. VM-36]